MSDEIYWITRLASLKTVATVFLVASSVLSVALFLDYLKVYRFDKPSAEDIRREDEVRGIFRKSLMALGVFFVLALFLPTSTELALMRASSEISEFKKEIDDINFDLDDDFSEK